MNKRVVRHDKPESVEKPACPICGQELDSRGVCMDRCAVNKDRAPAPTVRQG